MVNNTLYLTGQTLCFLFFYSRSRCLTISLSISLPLYQLPSKNDTTTKVSTDVQDTPSDFVHAYPLTAREQNMCDALISLLIGTIEEAQSITYAILEEANDRLSSLMSYNQRHDLL